MEGFEQFNTFGDVLETLRNLKKNIISGLFIDFDQNQLFIIFDIKIIQLIKFR